MGIRAKMHALVDELSEEELEELHRAAKARRARLKLAAEPGRGRSFLEAASKYIGAVDSGLGDLATNPKYMEGFGE